MQGTASSNETGKKTCEEKNKKNGEINPPVINSFQRTILYQEME
jgi:hypothetical protein